MTVDDPFGDLADDTTEKAEPKKAAPKKTPAPVEDAVPAKTEETKSDVLDLDAFLAEITSISVDEEDFEQPAEVIFRKYIKPANNTWIPLRITEAEVELREDQRAVVAVTKDGKQVMNPKAIDVLVEEHGATEAVIDDASFYQFRLKAEHVSEAFGDRPSPFLMFAPVADMRVPFTKPRKGNKNGSELGFDKKSGRYLIAATRVLKPNEKITPDEESLTELAQKMVGKTVMARVRRKDSTTKVATPRVKKNGQFVKAAADMTQGTFVELVKKGETFVHKGSGEVYEGDADQLIPFGESFLIPDDSDNAMIVKEMVEKTTSFDNLNDDVAPVPKMEVEITRVDGSDITATITWETVGFATTHPVKAGTAIQAEIIEDGNAKEMITASWIGTEWQETPQEHVLQVTEGGEVRIVPAASENPASLDGLDVFKGDAPQG